MLPSAVSIILATISTVLATNSVQTRANRQTSYSIYYLCGQYPNQYISYYPCPCTTCNQNCQNKQRCSTDMQCQVININLRCRNGCCTQTNNYPPITSTAPTTTTLCTHDFLRLHLQSLTADFGLNEANPLCDGREASAGYCRTNDGCRAGFTCTANNVCCRCSYGTSIGPCVNLQCPENFRCNENNECCPYQVG